MNSFYKIYKLILIGILFLIIAGCFELTGISDVDPESESFRLATVKGTIKSSSGIPLEGVTVSGVEVIRGENSATTDEEGKYEIPDVLPGETYAVAPQ